MATSMLLAKRFGYSWSPEWVIAVEDRDVIRGIASLHSWTGSSMARLPTTLLRNISRTRKSTTSGLFALTRSTLSTLALPDGRMILLIGWLPISPVVDQQKMHLSALMELLKIEPNLELELPCVLEIRWNSSGRTAASFASAEQALEHLYTTPEILLSSATMV